MIKEIKIDLLNSGADIIAHCANSQNTMASGVALAIKTKYPEVYEADLLTPKGDKNKLGTVGFVPLKSGQIKFCANLYGQYFYGYDGARYVNYEAIFSGLEKIRDFCVQNNLTKLAFPYNMASHRAGGDWRIVEKMIEVAFEKTNIEVLICKI